MPPTETDDSFNLEAFLPFILNQAAEAMSQAFQPAYRQHYGLTRTQWRVLAITGSHGRITARDICTIAHEEKSKVSRAVSMLEAEGLIAKTHGEEDKRTEMLSLTPKGEDVRQALGQAAHRFDATLRSTLGAKKEQQLRTLLREVQAQAGKLNI